MISKPRQSVEVLFLDQARSNTEPGPRWHWPLWVLLLMTGIGGLLRFSYLDRPCLWGDESLVYWRICGTYLQMLQPLTTDGFPPLHYELNWLIAHFFKPTPFVLRFVPAICGTLTIPAVYFFARQLVPRSTALVAAAITMCSGFMLNYSRDAKMYADCWLFVTLTCGCMLWWFRRGSFTAWLCWVASGCAACGIHASALAIVAVSPLLLFSQRKMHWRQSLFWLAGVAIIVSGPVGYYTKFKHVERARGRTRLAGERDHLGGTGQPRSYGPGFGEVSGDDFRDGLDLAARGGCAEHHEIVDGGL